MSSSGSLSASNGDYLHAPIVPFAFALGDDAFELGERQVNDAAIAWVHRLERDDFSFVHGLLAEPARHGRERVVAPAAVSLGVDGDVTAVEAGPIHDAVRQILNCSEHLALFP